MKQLYFICIAIFMSAISCTSAKESMQQTTPLYDTKWSLKKVYNNGKEETVNTKAFIRFDQQKGSAGGNGSCNSFGSNATINGNEVGFKNIFSTKMYCEGIQPMEDLFLGDLGQVDRFEIKDNKLFLYKDKELLLEFEGEVLSE